MVESLSHASEAYEQAGNQQRIYLIELIVTLAVAGSSPL